MPDKKREITIPRPSGGCAMRRILICLDGSPISESCLAPALALGRGYGSDLWLVHVLEPATPGGAMGILDTVRWQIGRREAEAYLECVAAGLPPAGDGIRTAVLEGHVAEQILCFADQQDIDLIALATHGEKGISEWTLASTPEKVLARARSSVLVVPAKAHPPAADHGKSLARILVLLDGSPRAEGALHFLERFARRHGATLILLHVVTPPELFEAGPVAAQDADLRSRLEQRNEHLARSYIGEIRSRLTRQGCEARAIVETGDLRALLPRLAARESIDLIAMTSHGRTGNRSTSYGDTAGHLIRNAPVPTLMIQSLPQRRSEFARAVRHRRGAVPLRGTHAGEKP